MHGTVYIRVQWVQGGIRGIKRSGQFRFRVNDDGFHILQNVLRRFWWPSIDLDVTKTVKSEGWRPSLTVLVTSEGIAVCSLSSAKRPHSELCVFTNFGMTERDSEATMARDVFELDDADQVLPEIEDELIAWCDGFLDWLNRLDSAHWSGVHGHEIGIRRHGGQYLCGLYFNRA